MKRLFILFLLFGLGGCSSNFMRSKWNPIGIGSPSSFGYSETDVRMSNGKIQSVDHDAIVVPNPFFIHRLIKEHREIKRRQERWDSIGW